MKILIVNTYYYPNMIGGTEQSVKLLAEGLAKIGHEVYVLTGDKDKKEEEVINSVNIIRLDLSKKNNKIINRIVRKGLEYNNVKIKSKIIEVIERVNPDVVHTNNLFYLSPIIWKIASEKEIKVVHTLRDYWGLCPKCTLLNKNLKICHKRKVLCKIHSSNYKKFSKYVDVVTAPSKFTLDIYDKHGIFNSAQKRMISNAIDIDFEKYDKIIIDRNCRKNEIIEYLFIGSLEEHKGIKFLLETFKNIENQNIRLTLCGSGNLEQYVMNICKIDKRISYLGSVFGNEKEKILKKSDVIIVPSIWYEPFGRVVIEGYKNGLVVIGSKIGGINELLESDVAIGVDTNNQEDLCNAILKLSNRDTLKKFVRFGKNYLNLYELNTQIDSFIKVYK